MNAETEMKRVRLEAQGRNVMVNGWQEGTENIPGFAMVTDNATCTTFGVHNGEPLGDAMGRAQARMGVFMKKHKSEGIRGGSRTTNAARTKGGGA